MRHRLCTSNSRRSTHEGAVSGDHNAIQRQATDAAPRTDFSGDPRGGRERDRWGDGRERRRGPAAREGRRGDPAGRARLGNSIKGSESLGPCSAPLGQMHRERRPSYRYFRRWVVPCGGRRGPYAQSRLYEERSSRDLSAAKSRRTHSASAANWSSFMVGWRKSVRRTSHPSPLGMRRIGT